MNTPISIVSTDPTGGASSSQVAISTPEDTSVHKGESNTDHQDATVFVDDGNVVVRDMSHMAHIDRTILQMQDTNFDEQSIKTFLSRPIVLRQGNFSTSDTYSTFLTNSMPYDALQSAQAVMWREKLRGIYGIRMDMKFRLVINANRFQQGRYILGWMPLAGPLRSVSSLKELFINNAHMATLVQRTTVPHVEIDLASDTVAELTVPFVSSHSFYNLNSILNSVNDYPLGYISLYPYSPMLSPAGSIVAGYTLYISFENVQLFGAASPQSGLTKHVRIADAEVSQKNLGPISSVSSALSKGFREFAHIPMLSTYATSISWVADRVTSVASVFGWSKPIAGDSMSKMAIYQAPNHNTIDGDSDARPLSFLSKPGVVAFAGYSGTDYDEMDFSYLVRRPAWFNTMTWTSLLTPGTILTNGSFNVTPYLGVTTNGCYHYQPVAFVASFFQEWRGSMRFRFKVVKTEFHSGRLSVAFYPGQPLTTLTGSEYYVHRQIIDIREATEFEFLVPFISDTPWCITRTGQLVFTVVDPLVAPATVSSSITILCEVSGGEDFEVAMPQPTLNISPSGFVPQSGMGDEATLITMNIGNSSAVADPIVSSSLAIGDKVSSFRSLLKRFTPLRYLDNTIATGIRFNDPGISIYTDALYAVSTIAPSNFIRADHYSIVSSCYAITRGGIRIRDVINKNLLITPVTTVYGPSMATVWSRPEVTSSSIQSLPINTLVSTTSEANVGAHVQFQDLALNGVITVENPQYTPTFMRSVADQWNVQGDATKGMFVGTLTSTTNQIVGISLPESGFPCTSINGRNVHNIYRALADDADFGLFISVPAMRPSAASTVPINNLY